MTKEDHTFLHDMMNKLSKIDGFMGILKDEGQLENNDHVKRIEKATNEAIDLLKKYRSLLESGENKR